MAETAPDSAYYFVNYRTELTAIKKMPKFVPDKRFTKPDSIAARVAELEQEFVNGADTFPGLAKVTQATFVSLDKHETIHVYEGDGCLNIDKKLLQSTLVGINVANFFDVLTYQVAKAKQPLPADVLLGKRMIELSSLVLATSNKVTIDYMLEILTGAPLRISGDVTADAVIYARALASFLDFTNDV